jgi:hypothetical protein
MAEHVFTLQEIADGGDPSSADDLARFEWTADPISKTPFDGTKGGGAKACPIKPWGTGGQQRTVRTNYPNAVIPAVQVLGHVHKPHTFSGRWDDRYNGDGYARFEWRRFVAMCKRGRIVRAQYGDIAYEGIITDYDCPVQRLWDIDYKFTLDVYNEPQESDQTRVPTTPNDALTSLDKVDLSVQAALDADALAPRNVLGGTLANDVTKVLVDMTAFRESLAASIDQSVLAPITTNVDVFSRIATQFRSMRGAASDLLVRLAPVRADLDMTERTAANVLDFEDWSRSLRYTARIVAGSSIDGDAAATEHAEPDAVRLYRPQAGEHLYGIARKFYGTPHAWALIHERNALHSFVMTGSETLIIPERGNV